jgi:hypothetical protein
VRREPGVSQGPDWSLVLTTAGTGPQPVRIRGSSIGMNQSKSGSRARSMRTLTVVETLVR